jgi:acetyl esterase/lipase
METCLARTPTRNPRFSQPIGELALLLFLGLLGGPATGQPATNAVLVVKDLAYRPENTSAYEKERCKLDLYVPASSSGKEFATLVWFHGGALKEGSKDDEFSIRIGKRLAELGLRVAIPNYRLSPKATYPAYIEDAAAAFAYVRAHIAEHGGDPARVFLGGHSAGAYLTLMLGLDPKYLARCGLGTSCIAGLVPVSGQTMTHYTVREERGLPKDTIIADEAAPIHYARKDAPPLLIVYADKDMPTRAEENRYLVAALKAAGHRRVTEQMILDRDHGSVAGNIARPGDPAAEAILAFIGAALRE